MSDKKTEARQKPAFTLTDKEIPQVGHYTQAEVAEILAVTPDTLTRWKKSGDGPPCIAVGTHITRYPIRAFHEWLKTCEVVSAPDVPRLAPPVHMSHNDNMAFARPKPAVPTGGDAA